jgi:uncharacterized protein YccT (UPF0319 family)
MSNVVIANKLPQTVSVTVLDDKGSPIELKLDAFQTSAAMPKERLTPHANQMAANGHIRVRSA